MSDDSTCPSPTPCESGRECMAKQRALLDQIKALKEAGRAQTPPLPFIEPRRPCISCGAPDMTIGPLCARCVRQAVIDRSTRITVRTAVLKRHAVIMFSLLKQVCVFPDQPMAVLTNPKVEDLETGRQWIAQLEKEMAELTAE